LRTQLSTAKSGTIERLRATGLAGDGENPGDRTRSGALLVLCAWSVFVVAGGMYAKFNENWSAVMPHADHWLPTAAYVAVEGAALVGALIVVVAGLIALSPFVRSVRQSGWTSIRRHVLRLSLVGGVTVMAAAGTIAWAHHLSYHNRNGGLWTYGVMFLLIGLMFIATLAVGTASVVSLTNRLQLSNVSLRALGRLALVMTLAMVVIIGGVITWWVAVAIHAPSVLGAGIPVNMVVSGILMVLGLATAMVGASRVVRAISGLQIHH
jgi:hypothetical protein